MDPDSTTAGVVTLISPAEAGLLSQLTGLDSLDEKKIHKGNMDDTIFMRYGPGKHLKISSPLSTKYDTIVTQRATDDHDLYNMAILCCRMMW